MVKRTHHGSYGDFDYENDISHSWICEYEYDSNNNPIKESTYSFARECQQINTYGYDERNNLIKWAISTNDSYGEKEGTFSYEYDECNNLIRAVSYVKDSYGEREEVSEFENRYSNSQTPDEIYLKKYASEYGSEYGTGTYYLAKDSGKTEFAFLDAPYDDGETTMHKLSLWCNADGMVSSVNYEYEYGYYPEYVENYSQSDGKLSIPDELAYFRYADFEYDNGRLLEKNRSGSGDYINRLFYEYDNNGNLSKITEYIFGDWESANNLQNAIEISSAEYRYTLLIDNSQNASVCVPDLAKAVAYSDNNWNIGFENLKSQSGIYAPYGFIFHDSDYRYLTESDLYGLSSEECMYARNEIYARRGRKFTSAILQDYFNSKAWYNPTIEAADFYDSMLNDCELQNARMIREYELEHFK